MNTEHKKTILFLFGGVSAEHDVSVMSAKNVYVAMDSMELNIVCCYIDRRGRWWSVAAIEEPVRPSARIMPLLGSGSILVGGKKVKIDSIFPVLHGKGGEDGTVQGLAALLSVPIVGCGIDGSLLCMDKVLAKQLLTAANIPVVQGKVCVATETPPSFAELTRELGSTLFIKPSRQGSSIGVGKATNEAEYQAAFQKAAAYDSMILIETAIEDAREIEIAVLGDSLNPRVSVLGEVLPDRHFYDYESKYSDNSTSQLVIPAALDVELVARIQRYAKQAFRALRCRGLARVDFFVAGDGALYVNEVNTMPGFTDISMYPKLWEASGLPYKDLVATLIEQAARYDTH